MRRFAGVLPLHPFVRALSDTHAELPPHQPWQVPVQPGSFADEPASQAGCGIDQTHADVPRSSQEWVVV